MTATHPKQEIILHDSHDNLGAVLKLAMDKKSVSIRQLNRATGISAPTISRIIAGKQAAGVYQLKLFADYLQFPIENLLMAMGVTNLKPSASVGGAAAVVLNSIFKDCEIDFETIIEDIKHELNKLEQYAKTKEGEKTILQGFTPKIQSIDGMGACINKLNHFYSRFCSPDISKEEQAVIGAALLYFILTAEVIPDYLYPIGHLDDAIAVTLAEEKLLTMQIEIQKKP